MSVNPYLPSLIRGSATVSLANTRSAVLDYQVYQKTGPKQFEAFKARPASLKAVQDFRDLLPEITSPEELSKNSKAMAFIMQAFGLGLDGDPVELGMTRRAMIQDLNDPKAIANVVKDPRYKSVTETLDLANSGVAKLSDPAVIDDLVARYLRTGFETEVGKNDSAVRDVIVFRRQIGSITRTMDILGNTVLRRVVTTALNMPAQMVNQSIERNVSDIDRRIDTTKFMLASTNAAGDGDATAIARTKLAKADAALATLDATTAKIDAMVTDLGKLQTDYAGLDASIAANAGEAARQRANLPGIIAAYNGYAATIDKLGINRRQLNGAINGVQEALGKLAAGDTAGATASLQGAAVFMREQAAALASLASADSTALAVTDQPAAYFDGSGTHLDKTLSITSSVSVPVKVHDISAALNQVNSALAAVTGGGALDVRLNAMLSALTQGQAVLDQANTALTSEYQALKTGMAAMGGPAIALDTAGVAGAKGLAAAGKATVDDLMAKLGKMQLLAVVGSEPSYAGDRAADLAALRALAVEMRSAIDASDYKDPATGTTRSLLRDSAHFDYGLARDGSSSLGLDAVPLEQKIASFSTDIYAQSAGWTTADAAKTLASIMALRPDIQRAGSAMTGAVEATSAASARDPRVALDARYRDLVKSVTSKIGTPVENPTFGSVQLLGADAESVALPQLDPSFLLKLRTQSQLSTSVVKVLVDGAGVLTKTGQFDSTSQPWTALRDALSALNTANVEMKANRDEVTAKRQEIVTANPDAATPFQEGNTGADPFVVQTTDFTEQFVKRYLAAVDIGSYSSGTSHYQSAILIMNAQNSLNSTSI